MLLLDGGTTRDVPDGTAPIPFGHGSGLPPRSATRSGIPLPRAASESTRNGRWLEFPSRSLRSTTHAEIVRPMPSPLLPPPTNGRKATPNLAMDVGSTRLLNLTVPQRLDAVGAARTWRGRSSS